MNKTTNSKKYDLEERCFIFAKDIREFVNLLPRRTLNIDDYRQLIRSSGSIGANYIEANESLSKKDFVHRIKISRKEAKETVFWLKLIDTSKDSKLEILRKKLIGEATELMKIFSAIAIKSS